MNNGFQRQGPMPVREDVAAEPFVAKNSKRSKPSQAIDDGPPQDDGHKRRVVVSSACLACRRRKSKCDGALPSCAACASVYGTPCIYSPDTDHRRKGVYKKDIDNLKTRNSTLQTLISAILSYPEDEVGDLVQQMRTSDNLDHVAESVVGRERDTAHEAVPKDDIALQEDPTGSASTFEKHLAGKLGAMRLEDGSTRYFGGTSHLAWTESRDCPDSLPTFEQQIPVSEDPVTSWTKVTSNKTLIMHLLNHYFSWHYTYFCILPEKLFWRDFYQGRAAQGSHRMSYCSPLLVNTLLSLGCHFTAWPEARENPLDSATAGDHFFREAKRLLMVNDEHEHPKLTTVQALALMSVREAGCGREARGWVYSGMSFRMACDLGLNLDSGIIPSGGDTNLDDAEEDARRITFWGCFLFDKCWSNYLGRMPQLPTSLITVPKFDVFPDEDSRIWAAYTDSGFNQTVAQPARTRAIALQISKLCEISTDLITSFYNPMDINKPRGRQAELKLLGDLHKRLENWKRNLPPELEPREGSLPHAIIMHMFFQLFYLHLFRPFLKYSQSTTPLPANTSPRKMCTQAAAAISKLMRLYKRTYGLHQICNIVVYITHSACAIHLLNLPDKNARRDINHGVKHLEEIAEYWLCARRSLVVLRVLSEKWGVELPEEALAVITRAERKYAASTSDPQRPANRRGPSMDSMPYSPERQTSVPNTSVTSYLPQASSEVMQPMQSTPLVSDDPFQNVPTGLPSTGRLPPNFPTQFQNQAQMRNSYVSDPGWNASQAIAATDSRSSSPDRAHSANPESGPGSETVSSIDGQEFWKDSSQLSAGLDGNWLNNLDVSTPAWNSIAADPFVAGGYQTGNVDMTDQTTAAGEANKMGRTDILNGVGGLNSLNAYNMAPFGTSNNWY